MRRDLVRARREGGEAVGAGAVGDCFQPETAGADCRHGRAGDHGSLGVSNDPFDGGTLLLAIYVSRAGEHQQDAAQPED